MKNILKRCIFGLIAILMSALLFIYGLSAHVKTSTEDHIFQNIDEVPELHAVIVLGAGVRSNGKLSRMLEDRVQSALELYQAGKVKRFLLSGDNGTKYYNEPQAMKEYLLREGVPEDAIFLDYAGFDTYDSMYRAGAVFEAKDAIIVSQEFHVPRSVYIARELGYNYYGYTGDKHTYQQESSLKRRELLANVKAFAELLINKEPTYLGAKIPITGPPQSTYSTD